MRWRRPGRGRNPRDGRGRVCTALSNQKWLSGTDATHAEHIETIKARMYVGLTADKRFLPGHLGMGLVEGEQELEVAVAEPCGRSPRGGATQGPTEHCFSACRL